MNEFNAPHPDLIQPGKATVLMGGQYGSEAKGLAAGVVHLLSGTSVPKWCTTNAGAQAGHTTVMGMNKTFVCYHLPTLGVLDRHSNIYVNAGAVIDPDLFNREIAGVAAVTGENEDRLRGRIFVDPYAAVIWGSDHISDVQSARIGSTMKGIGPALANKIMRRDDAVVKNDHRMKELGISIRRVDLMAELRKKHAVTIEIPQGTGLSLNSSGHYPYTTSRECWLGQGLTDAAVHPSYLAQSIMVCRTLPIRVGNVFDEEGKQIGTSGPFCMDSRELDWSMHLPSIEPERTTVTKRIRRIATWSTYQYERSLYLNRPDMVVLTFCNYLSWENLRTLAGMIATSNARVGLEPRMLFSWGPNSIQTSPVLEACRPHCRLHDNGQDAIHAALMNEGEF